MDSFVRPRPEGCVVIEMEKLDFIYKVHTSRRGPHPLSTVRRDVQLIPRGTSIDTYIVYKTPTGAIMHYLEGESGEIPKPTVQYVMNASSKPTIKKGSRTYELLKALNVAVRQLTGYGPRGEKLHK